MKFRAHGANPERIFADFGIGVPDVIYDFSTNTNAVGAKADPGCGLSLMLENYPDDESTAVRAIAADINGCGVDEVIVTNGSNEAVYLLASYQSGRRNCILEPAYGEYLTALSAYKAKVRFVRGISDVNDGDDTVWICNPCNPTGKYIGDSGMERLFSDNPATLFIIDEAYRDFLYGYETPPHFRNFANVVMLRSLTKTYRLCGARIGYVLADPGIISLLKQRQPSWSVNAPAQAAAASLMKDSGFVEKTRAFYRSEMPRFMGALRDAGCEILPSSVNFFLMKTDDDEALMGHLLSHGIVVRHTRNFPGLDGKYVRIAARTPEENDIFIKAMKH